MSLGRVSLPLLLLVVLVLAACGDEEPAAARDDAGTLLVTDAGVRPDRSISFPDSSGGTDFAVSDSATDVQPDGLELDAGSDLASEDAVAEDVAGDAVTEDGTVSDDMAGPECGNGLVELGEACDGDCPTACETMEPCTPRLLQGSIDRCDVTCVDAPIIACGDDDDCCLPSCDFSTDNDCSASCGDGDLDEGETCDPREDCPTDCAPLDECTPQLLSGSAANCNAACTPDPIVACEHGDGCCAPGCHANNDDDCEPDCGNGEIEDGESCDGDCPAICEPLDDCTPRSLTGSADTCDVACTDSPIRSCDEGDNCCPEGCHDGNDSDCPVTCGNGDLDEGETCDLACPTSCAPINACTPQVLSGNPAACTSICVPNPIDTCIHDDNCCAPGCNANEDNDCLPDCGNGVQEPGETCDGDCPTSCTPVDACTPRVLAGSPGSCDVTCEAAPIASCIDGDLCCPAGCDGSDTDCGVTAVCGNNVLEPGEWCDPKRTCPRNCNDREVCTTDTLLGHRNTCDARCVFEPNTDCISGDGCCSDACIGLDSDCGAVCGDSNVEFPETCDGNCPTSCAPLNSCTPRVLTGLADDCDVLCEEDPIVFCVNGDGCCPTGCDLDSDDDCTSSCSTCTDGDGCCGNGCDITNDNGCVLDCTDPATWPATWVAYEDEVLRLTNIARGQDQFCGADPWGAQTPLAMNAQLRQAARCHTIDMMANNFVDHPGTDGSDASVRVDRTGYDWSIVGENVAGGQVTPAEVVQGLMDSPGHCTNIMEGLFTEIGVSYGYWRASDYWHFWAQVFASPL